MLWGSLMDSFYDNETDDICEIVSGNQESHSIFETYNYVVSNFSEIPAKELLKRGSISEVSIPELVAFYSANLEGTTLFRKAKNATSAIGQAWAGIVKSKAVLEMAESPPPHFEGIDASFINDVVHMSPDLDSINKLQSKLRSIGIILIFEQAIARSSVDGVAGKLPNGTPYIGMSLRLHRLDNFWFTLLHELGHVALHYDQLHIPIIDSEEDNKAECEIELEADRFALNSFVNRRVWNTASIRTGKAEEMAVLQFARKHAIHPAIVAGRIRKETGNYRLYNRLVKINVREIILGE